MTVNVDDTVNKRKEKIKKNEIEKMIRDKKKSKKIIT